MGERFDVLDQCRASIDSTLSDRSEGDERWPSGRLAIDGVNHRRLLTGQKSVGCCHDVDAARVQATP
jgi:hypothetical protein